MPWPTSQDYFEAVQNPQLNFGEAELRLGKPRLSPMGLPIVMSGNFADVYPIECPVNRTYAVKCFTREVPGQRDRYREISAHLQQVKLPFTVEFSYLDGEQGIRIRGQWYPVLKMEWVEGTTLNQFVSENVQKPQMLEALGQLWVQLAQKLRDARIAHADLQHGNVLLVPVPGAKAGTVKLKLIDYDGMFVPALANRASGELGHVNYQHPARFRDQVYSTDVDRFPHLVICTALPCVGGTRVVGTQR
jgi:Ser/Thr protein kinase RdoA (MazF antagonist)